MTNNEAELWAVYNGLRIAARNGYRNLEIEGDSRLMIDMLRKLRGGKSWDHVAKSWRTAGIIQDIEGLMQTIDYITINHVLRRGNRAADFLANWACGEPNRTLDGSWLVLQVDPRWTALSAILRQDNEEALTLERTD